MSSALLTTNNADYSCVDMAVCCCQRRSVLHFCSVHQDFVLDMFLLQGTWNDLCKYILTSYSWFSVANAACLMALGFQVMLVYSNHDHDTLGTAEKVQVQSRRCL